MERLCTEKVWLKEELQKMTELLHKDQSGKTGEVEKFKSAHNNDIMHLIHVICVSKCVSQYHVGSIWFSALVISKVEERNIQLMKEIEDERQHHQKLVKDYGRLQQRLENIRG